MNINASGNRVPKGGIRPICPVSGLNEKRIMEEIIALAKMVGESLIVGAGVAAIGATVGVLALEAEKRRRRKTEEKKNA